MKNIVLIGGGGHCRSCIDVLEQEAKYTVAGIVDSAEKQGELVLGYEVFAEDDQLEALVSAYQNFLVTIGQIKDPGPRKKTFEHLKALGGSLPVIVSPRAYVSRHARVEEGTIILPYAVVNAGARVGKNCIINTRAVVEHDAIVGNHCHLATGSIVNGGAQIGNEVFLGSGAIVREGVEIGANNVIGCQAAVRKDIETARGIFF